MTTIISKAVVGGVAILVMLCFISLAGYVLYATKAQGGFAIPVPPGLFGRIAAGLMLPIVSWPRSTIVLAVTGVLWTIWLVRR